MTKRIKFTATFADGTTLTRTSDRKEYTHGWRITFRRGPIPASWSAEAKKYAEGSPEGSLGWKTGFASSFELAHKAAASEYAAIAPSKRTRRGTFGEPRPYELVSTEVVAVTREG